MRGVRAGLIATSPMQGLLLFAITVWFVGAIADNHSQFGVRQETEMRR